MKVSIKNIAKQIKGKIKGNESLSFSSLITDSRAAVNSSDALFIALKSKRNDGHNFIKNLYERGLRCFMISDKKLDTKEFPEACFLIVENTLDGLQSLATYNRSFFKKNVIGITGSNGKTIVKEWLYHLLHKDYSICRSPKSYNSQIGVALSVWGLDGGNTLGIFEAGISKPGEMEKLERIISPETGIITNIRAPHDEDFIDRKQKTKEKLKLFIHSKKLIYCKDHREINYCLKDKIFSRVKKVSWGKNKNASLIILKIKKENNGAIIFAEYKKKKLSISIPFTDDASIENVMHCWLYMLSEGYDNKQLLGKFISLAPVAMRLELKQGVNNCSLINDSYNSDLESLSIALDFLNRQHQHAKKTIILSDIFQSGKKEKDLYAEVAALLKAKRVNRMIGVGNALRRNKNLFNNIERVFFTNTAKLLSEVGPEQFYNEAILLKGSRMFEFEQIGTLLQQKSHDTVLQINLNNVIHNLNYYKGVVRPGTGIMGMVKAFSYGSGSYEIASALQHHNVNYLAVAYSDEGVELRKGGIKLPIMVMSPEPQSFNDLVEYNLEPEIFSTRLFDLFAGFIKSHSDKGRGAPHVHIKIDTGMHRLGFEEKDFNLLIKKIKENSHLQIASVFSHLAASDEKSLTVFTENQIKLFDRLSKKIIGVVQYKILRHLCNSAAAARFPNAHFDMIRLGIGMYGIGASAEEQKKLLSAGTLQTTISQIKKITLGGSVGYGRKGVIKQPTTIATVPIGYADGYARQFSNGNGCMYINGFRAKTIGNVCMDMCMLDITGIDAKEGDDVIIFNSAETLSEMAKQRETIPYEILTSISPRVKRIYLEE